VALVEHMDADTRRDARNKTLTLARSIRERDTITYTHSRRVATYSQRLARAMGWPRRLAHDLALCALLHDLGKTWIENEVLHKTSALSTDERTAMERHPVIGARILEAYGAPRFMVDAVLHHHEMYDGRGYPDHLSGEAIPIAARMLTVCDVFDVLTSERPYKAALSQPQALERIQASAGTHFDLAVVDAFVRLVSERQDFLVPRHHVPEPPESRRRASLKLDEFAEP
jgi:putative nucleotidyltransferase with HDIG domain